jgi:hypothetical protein
MTAAAGGAAPLLGVLHRLAVGSRDHDERAFLSKAPGQLQGLASGVLFGLERSRHPIHVDGSDNVLHSRSPIERKPRSVALRRNGFPPIGLPNRGDEFASQYPQLARVSDRSLRPGPFSRRPIFRPPIRNASSAPVRTSGRRGGAGLGGMSHGRSRSAFSALSEVRVPGTMGRSGPRATGLQFKVRWVA